MERKYYLRGLGLGIVMTAIIMGVALSGNKTMTDEERKTAMEASTNYYKNSEKEGSLASKAAMVAKYNERTKK